MDTARQPPYLKRSEGTWVANTTDSRFTEAALERHKREGMDLAVKARWIGLAVVAVMLPFLDFRWEVLYYHALLAVLAAIGWAQRRVARTGLSSAELALILCDLLVMTVAIALPNPFETGAWLPAVEFRVGGFMYSYVLLAAATLAFSWRTVRGYGSVTGFLWIGALVVIWAVTSEDEALTEATQQAFGTYPELANFLNPNNYLWYVRVQEIVVFIIVAATLALTVRRYDTLLQGHTALERERTNLARYFSPNVVEELSQNDEPLKQIRTQNIAVLFVDIVGFTRYAAGRSPETVILTLREFHQRMEAEVFRHTGTLDKYLGDGLMATFGTPVAGNSDASNGLRCARSMIRSLADWNAERVLAGEPPIRAGFGLHYGPAVLGNIGANRLEFAVIGNTVNIASRVEALTRPLSVTLAATDDLLQRARSEAGRDDHALIDLTRHEGLEIRGLDTRMTVWTWS